MASRATTSRWLVGSSSRRTFAAGQQAYLLERVVTPEQEARQVPAGLARRDGHRLEERVEHRRSGEGRRPELGEVAELDAVPERHGAVERRELARDGPQQGRLAGAVGTHDADPVTATRGEERGMGDPGGREVADDEVLHPDDRLARADRPSPDEPLARQSELPRCLGRLLLLREEALEPRLVLVHLRDLPVAPIRLDQLALAGDLLLVGVGALGGEGVALLALPVVGRVVAAE
jgi:hypothetical protein